MIKREFVSDKSWGVIDEISEYYGAIPVYLSDEILDLIEEIRTKIRTTMSANGKYSAEGDYFTLEFFNLNNEIWNLKDHRDNTDIFLDCLNAMDEIELLTGEEKEIYPGAGYEEDWL